VGALGAGAGSTVGALGAGATGVAGAVTPGLVVGWPDGTFAANTLADMLRIIAPVTAAEVTSLICLFISLSPLMINVVAHIHTESN